MIGTDGYVVDADGHVLELRHTWLRYIDPKYRDRAIQIGTDEQGWEMLLIDGKSHPSVHGIMGAIGGVGMENDVARCSRVRASTRMDLSSAASIRPPAWRY